MTSDTRRAGAEILKLIEMAADPAAVANQILAYAKDVAGVTQLFARASDGTVFQLTPSGGANIVVWTAAKTWAQAYAEILATTGPVICLVEDGVGGASRVMTNNGGAPTQLWNVQFWALIDQLTFSGINSIEVDVDDGFVLDEDPINNVAILMSKNIKWDFQVQTAPIATGDVYTQIDGGQLRITTGDLFVTDNFKGRFRNGALLFAANAGSSIVQLTSNLVAGRIYVESWSDVNQRAFRTVAPATPQIDVYTEPTVTVGGIDPFGAGIVVSYISYLIMFSPDGTLWTGTVDNAGVLTFA